MSKEEKNERPLTIVEELLVREITGLIKKNESDYNHCMAVMAEWKKRRERVDALQAEFEKHRKVK